VALSSGMFLAQGRIREAIRTGQGALSLDELDLAALPESLGGLTALTELYLQGNQLTALPEWLGGLTASPRSTSAATSWQRCRSGWAA